LERNVTDAVADVVVVVDVVVYGDFVVSIIRSLPPNYSVHELN